jgi:curli biogenesis system outer membrane secretion channel CsgG
MNHPDLSSARAAPIPRTPIRSIVAAVLFAAIAGCATTAPQSKQVAAPASVPRQADAQQQASAPVEKVLKRKIAIGRITNETRYGRSFMVDGSMDPLGKQAADMLANRLVASKQFLVFERPDLDKIKAEQGLTRSANLVGVDALILGSITEFGRSTTGKTGFLSGTKVQTAHAKVELRLVDARTGYVFFTASGTGDASTESGEIAGFGSRADYDASLNDRAIGAAISDVESGLVGKLSERPWRTDVLKVDGGRLYLSGGASQGLKVGDRLAVYQPGETVRSAQTGFDITLPSKSVARVEVTSLFGEDETSEGAIAQLLAGSLSEAQKPGVYVGELRE